MQFEKRRGCSGENIDCRSYATDELSLLCPFVCGALRHSALHSMPFVKFISIHVRSSSCLVHPATPNAISSDPQTRHINISINTKAKSPSVPYALHQRHLSRQRNTVERRWFNRRIGRAGVVRLRFRFRGLCILGRRLLRGRF